MGFLGADKERGKAAEKHGHPLPNRLFHSLFHQDLLAFLAPLAAKPPHRLATACELLVTLLLAEFG